jgi:hypothetical protein
VEAGANRKGRPQLGLPRLLGMKVRPRPLIYSAELESAIEMMVSASVHEKGPEESGPASLSGWECQQIRRWRFGIS